MTVPFKPGDRIRLKANHAIEAVVLKFEDDGFWFTLSALCGSQLFSYHVAREWERVPQPMPTLEPGMVVQTSAGTGVSVVHQPWSWAGKPITRVGRVEWIWERDVDDAH